MVSPSATTAGIGTAPKTTILQVFGWLRRLLFPSAPDPFAGLDPARTRLIVGLGNPGPEYAWTRHNVGFLMADELARRCASRWQRLDELNSLISVAQAGDLRLVLAKPQTYMNRSGAAVSALVEELDISLDNLLVVYDDMDLPFGMLRLRERGSPGTHNGMRSVVAVLRSEAVPRLRIGISQAQPGSAIDHVLGEFAEDEADAAQELVQRAADAAYAWATESAVAAMNRYNKS
jgi:PTH1 family peptidyl-tRNA hydrolase